MTPGLVTLIPANRLDRAKGRLAEVIPAKVREALALATLATVVEAAAAVSRVVVLTADPRVAAAVDSQAEVMAEVPGVEGLNAQLEAAVRALLPLDELLILHGDLPLASADGLRALLAAAPHPPSATMVESGDGGTNALLLRPPGGFALAYGKSSYARHAAAAEAAGYAVGRHGSDALALDLDTPADLRRFLALPGSAATAAGQVLRAAGRGR